MHGYWTYSALLAYGDNGREHGAHAPHPFTPATLAARKVGQFVIAPFKSVLRERVV
jgi:hypothetical protein